jgi:hypothetical protein
VSISPLGVVAIATPSRESNTKLTIIDIYTVFEKTTGLPPTSLKISKNPIF